VHDVAGIAAQLPPCGEHRRQRGLEYRGEFFGGAGAKNFHVVDVVFVARVDDPAEHLARVDSDDPHLRGGHPRG
jgi:hypothetical protein